MPQIADALKISLPDLLETLWREKDGDHCPCGRCDGKKSFSDTGPEAWTLAIVIPCAKCGLKRIHKQWKKSRHRNLCSTCAKSAERAEHMVVTCRGYQDHRATRHAATCRGTVRRRSSYVKNLSSFDHSSMTYQCNDCGGAERLHTFEEEALEKLYAKKYPHENVPKTQSRQQRLKMRHVLHREFSPNFKATYEAQELGRQRYIQNAAAGKKYSKKTIANLRRHWLGISFPGGIRFGICSFCKKFTMTENSDDPRFHWVCHNEWERTREGRQFQSRARRRETSQEASLAPSKGGRPKRYSDNNAGDDLATAYRWAIQHFLEKKSLRQIGKESGVPFNTVRDQIHSLVKKLPDPKLLASQFQTAVRELIAASGSLVKESETLQSGSFQVSPSPA